MPYQRAGSGYDFVCDSHVYNAVDAGSQLITTVLGFAPILTAIALLFRQHILDYFVARVGELEKRPAQILTVLLGCLRRVCDAYGGWSRLWGAKWLSMGFVVDNRGVGPSAMTGISRGGGWLAFWCGRLRPRLGRG
jgi:hypothetical protein